MNGKTTMDMLTDAAATLVNEFKEYQGSLEKTAAEIAADRQKLETLEKELAEREAKVARRENEVGQVRQIAADRKVQAEAAKEAADRADKSRRNAEAETRLAKREKQDLEVVLAKLLQEKTELTAQLAAVPQLQFIKDNAVPAAEVPVEKV